MSINVNLNGIPYQIPTTGEQGWGQDLTNYLVATAGGGLLQLQGGAFTLTSDVNFGANFGLQSKYYKGLATPTASSGIVRLGNAESVVWRNSTDDADLALSLVGDQLYFAGVPVGGGGGSSPLTTKGDLYTFSTIAARLPVGINGQTLLVDSSTATGLKWGTVGGAGSGTVTGVSVVTANGVSGSVATPTTTPAITLSLDAITPTSVAAVGTVTGSNISGTHTGTSSGTNTGDQTITLTGAVTGTGTGTFATTLATVSIAKGGTGQTTASDAINALVPSQTSNSGKVLITNGTVVSWAAFPGAGSVTSVSATGANGISITGSPITTTGTLAFSLGAITPTSVAASGTVTGSNISGTASGTNTGDQTITLTGAVTGTGTGTFATTLANSGVTAATYTNATITVNNKGLITSAANGASGSTSIAFNGDVSGSGVLGTTFTSTLATLSPAVGGTYNNVVVNGKGLVTSGSNASYLTANQTITLSGDVSGSGTTGISATLASSGVTAGTYTNTTITVDAKGRVTAASSGGTSVANIITNSATTAVGINAAVGITSAFYNTAMGNNALRVTASGQYNSAFGDQSMRNNTGNSNSAFGYLSLYTNTSGFSNAAFGREALYSLQTNGQCTAIGQGAGYSITGSNNTAIGYNALWASTTGSNNTGLGYNAASSTTTISNEITLGNSSVATLRCQVTSITALSDARDKTDIATLPVGLDFVNDLKPVAFTWNMRDGGKVGIKSSGFIAQDLLASETKFDVKDTLNLVMDSNPDKLEATYGHLVPVLVKAIQELSAEIAALKNRLNII